MESQAKEGTPAFRPLGIGKARIEGTFRRVVYCNVKREPVCLIIIDLDFEYCKGHVLKEAQICLTIESESPGDGIGKAEDGIQSASSSKPALLFGPRDLFGSIKYVESRNELAIGGGVQYGLVQGPGFKISTSKTEVRESRWHVQGRAEREAQVREGQTYAWLALGNKVALKDFASDKTFPRKLSVWMIFEHKNTRFHADIEVTAKLRRDWHLQTWSRRNDKRGTERGIDRKVFEPTSSTKSLNIDKLNQLINARNENPHAYTFKLDLDRCLRRKLYLQLRWIKKKLRHGIRKERRYLHASG